MRKEAVEKAKTSEEVTEQLILAIEDVTAGRMTPEDGNAVSAAAKKALKRLKAEAIRPRSGK